MMRLFLLFILAYLLNEFVFTFKSSTPDTLKKVIKLFSQSSFYILIIIGIFYILNKSNNYYSYINIYSKKTVLILISLFLMYLVINFLFYFIIKTQTLISFIFKQITYIICIYLITYLFLNHENKHFLYYLNFDLYLNSNFNATDKFLFVSILILIGVFFAATFISLYLKKLSPVPIISNQSTSVSKNLSLKDDNLSYIKIEFEDKVHFHYRGTSTFTFGRTIGLVERMLIILLISVNNYATIAIIIALKTLTRFKLIEEDKDFGEYYLMGNLLSLLFSISTGILIKFILHL